MTRRKTTKILDIPSLRLFSVDNHELVIDKDEVRGIKEFADILKKRKTCKGDSDGRKKVMATKELLYVKFMADIDTVHSAFTGEERHKRAKEDADLPRNWSPDDEVEAAIEKYKEIINEYSYTASILNSVEQGLLMSSKAVKTYIRQMQTAIEASNNLVDKMTNDIDADKNELAESMESVNSLIQTSISKILKIATDLPATLSQIKDLQEQVKEDASKNRTIRGGHRKGNREDPS
jgi:hypothetical protein